MREPAIYLMMLPGLALGQAPRGVDEALEAAREATFMVGENASEGARRFDRGLAFAAARMSPESRERARRQEGPGILDRLATLAVDRQERPQVYEELIGAYAFHQRRIAPRVESPLGEHCTEAYRLVWEWILLKPVASAEELPLDTAAAEALGTIGNRASIVTLEHALAVARKGKGDRRRVAARRGKLVGALLAFPDPRGARALLGAIVAIYEATAENQVSAREKSGQATAAAMRRLSPERQTEWVAVLSDLEGMPAGSEPLAAEIVAWLSVEKAFEMTRMTIARTRLSRLEPSEAARELEEAATRYRSALDRAGAAMGRVSATAASPHDGIRARLFEIARDREERRGVYEAISRYEEVDPIAVRREEVGPAFTLAWEFLLLSPRPAERLAASHARAANALGRIGDPESTTALVHSFRAFAGADTVLNAEARSAEESLLEAFALMPSAAAGSAVCEAVELAERQPTADHEFGEWQPAAHFVKAVSERGRAQTARWRLALLDATRGGMPCLESVAQRLRSLLGDIERE